MKTDNRTDILAKIYLKGYGVYDWVKKCGKSEIAKPFFLIPIVAGTIFAIKIAFVPILVTSTILFLFSCICKYVYTASSGSKEVDGKKNYALLTKNVFDRLHLYLKTIIKIVEKQNPLVIVSCTLFAIVIGQILGFSLSTSSVALAMVCAGFRIYLWCYDNLINPQVKENIPDNHKT